MDIDLGIKSGLPKEKVGLAPLLKQFNVGSSGKINSATMVYDDGTIFMLSDVQGRGVYNWFELTKLKPQGIKTVAQLIQEEFNHIVLHDYSASISRNMLIWESCINNTTKTLKLPSGPYSSLPPVFKKIDDSINEFMYKMNEQKNEKEQE